MAESYQRQQALAHHALDALRSDHTRRGEGAGVQMWMEKACGQLCLRGAANSRFASVVESVWGMPLPVAANTASGHDHNHNHGQDHDREDNDDSSDARRRILWLGPDEWLAVCAESDLHELHAALDRQLADEHVLVSDVSHSRIVIALRGEHASEVLNKGCSLDLDPVAFKAGQCAQTMLARAHMLLHQVSDEPRYHVYAHRSFADYIYAWLDDAAREYR
jgi:sarcosine oxidase subunit gamma